MKLLSLTLPLALYVGFVASATATPLPFGVAPYPGAKLDKPEPLPDVSGIGLERTRCLVGCPAYTVTIYPDGSFSYTGEYGVERLGHHTGRVNVGQLRQLLKYVGEIDFMAFEPSYLSPYLDNATTVTTVVLGGQRKTVTNYANSGPATLWALEQLIDALLAGATWDAGGGRK